MRLETARRILTTTDDFCTEVGKALGIQELTYETMVRSVQDWIRQNHNKTVSDLLLGYAQRVFPSEGEEVALQPEKFPEYVAAIDTREKAEAVLLAVPEPDPSQLGAFLSGFRTLLPNLRQALLPFAKRLPHPPGGRPKKLADPADRQRVRKSIAALYADGLEMPEAKKRVARQERVSVSTLEKRLRNGMPRRRKNDSQEGLVLK